MIFLNKYMSLINNLAVQMRADVKIVVTETCFLSGVDEGATRDGNSKQSPANPKARHRRYHY